MSVFSGTIKIRDYIDDVSYHSMYRCHISRLKPLDIATSHAWAVLRESLQN